MLDSQPPTPPNSRHLVVGKKPQVTMAETIDHRHFIELNDFSVAVLRTSGPKNASVIEEYRDACLDDADAVDAVIGLARSTDAKAPTTVICSVRSDQSFLHLATADEAVKHSTTSAISTFLAQRASIEATIAESASVYADTGDIVDGSSKHPWLGAVTNSALRSQLLAKLGGWGLIPERVESAAFSLYGAVQGSLTAKNSEETVVIWEVGKTTSNLTLVSARGVEGARRISFGFDRIADAILAEIQLKLKGAAGKLFFNNHYDFYSTGPKIAKRIADTLATEMSQLVSKRSPGPKKFILGGFPSKQDWFPRALAQQLGLETFDLNVQTWLATCGIRVADNSALAKLSPTWLGTFGLAAAHSGQNVGKSPSWHPAWTAAAANPYLKTAPVTPTLLVNTAPEPEKQQLHSESSATDKQPRTSKSASQSPTLPSEVRIANPDTLGLSEDNLYRSKRKKGQLVRNLTVAASVIGLLGVGILYFQSVEKHKQAATEAKQLAAQQAAANERARFEAEQKARSEAAPRRRAEEEIAAKTAADEAARLQAEEAARLIQIERDRLLNARGSVLIASIPSGAKVSIANLESQLSPATFSDLRLGQYSATLELDGHEATTIDFTVDEDEMTEPGPVRLARHTGKLEITTKPIAVRFNVKPTSLGPFTSAMQSRIGITPHTLGSLPTDEYIITLEREGLPSISRTVTIEHDETTALFEDLSSGAVKITSNPPGASVFGQDDSLLGITPLVIDRMAAGEVSFTLKHLHHSPVTLTGNIKIGAITNLATDLKPIKLSRKASSTKRVEPNFVDPKKWVGHNAVISLIVNEEGIPESVEVEQASNPEFGQLCLEAACQWEFKPARIGRKPVSSRVKIPFTIK